jgi:glycine betaine/proline transport system substrate-binding protein
MRRTSLLGVLMFLLALPAAAQESRDAIRIAVHDWTGQRITASIAGGMLRQMGYQVRYVVVDYLKALEAMARGEVDLVTEQRASTADEAMAKADARGDVEKLGPLGPKAREDWWYPLYMKERCPGLPDWKALKNCGEVFSTPDTKPLGRYLGLPGMWGGNDQERIDALGLPFVVVDASNEDAMFADLRDSYRHKAPLMVWAYSPHWVGARFEGEWVEFPPYDPSCYTDSKWGPNPDKTYDCGKPRGDIWKYATLDMKTKWPQAYRTMKRLQIDQKELEEMVAAVDLDGQLVPSVATRWLARHREVWERWAAP